jgi:hypothetical protein
MVRVLRRRFDDDESDYDPKYPGKRVFRDGRGPRVPLYMTDSAPRQPVYDGEARARAHQRLLDGYGRLGAAVAQATAGHRPGQVSLSDAEVRAARSKSEHAREQWISRMKDQYRRPIGAAPPDGQDENGEDLPPGVDPVEFARAQRIRRDENAWKQPPMWRGAASGPSPSDTYPPHPSPYAAGVWEAERRSPDLAQRRTSLSPTDAGEDAKQAAYDAYVARITSDWRK